MTAGHDHTCRVWKVPEESQLIFRAHAPALDAVRYVTGTEWLSGGADGSLALWRHAALRPLTRGQGCLLCPCLVGRGAPGLSLQEACAQPVLEYIAVGMPNSGLSG